MRPSEDDVWADVAEAVSLRSRCVRSQVGCVIVGADGRVAATGYNGPPRSWEPGRSGYDRPCTAWCHRADDGADDFSDCPSVHAEMNALLYSDRRAREGGTAYLTRDPCWACTVALAASGVVRVVWPRAEESGDPGRIDRVVHYLQACSIFVDRRP